MPFFDLESRPALRPVPGVTLRAVWGERMLMSFLDLEPNAEIPTHSHPHEQVGVGLSGVFALTIGEETRHIRPGDPYCIPSGVPHRAVALAEGARALDVFSPPREDYQKETP
ncbi:MAG: cupin domain-containing protein [Armatimonadetes bacterium]|nr:cupin domain-containing protein [Armatimonadota bacterium]